MKKLEILTDDEKKILRLISFHYKEHASKLDIKQIKFQDNIVHIVLGRPGIFIGKKGKDFNNIIEIFREDIDPEIKIHLEESSINMYFYCSEY